jgi:hypothetical protein
MAKIINVDEDGMITGVEPSSQGFLFEFREVEVRDLEGLAQAIAMAARDPYSIVVRAKPKQAIGRRAMYDDADAGPANLTVTPCRWVAFDWDNIPVPHDPESIELDQAEFANWARPPALFKPDLGVELALRRLPPAFRTVSCLWQITASAGFKGGFRLRTWHWLSRALTGSQLKCWLNPAIERGLVDPSTLVEVQPHYVGCTVRGGPDLLRAAGDGARPEPLRRAGHRGLRRASGGQRQRQGEADRAEGASRLSGAVGDDQRQLAILSAGWRPVALRADESVA